MAPPAENDASHAAPPSTAGTLSSNEPTLAERTELALAEGHDADIPSNIGYVLDESGEKRRRQSISAQRRASLQHRTSTSSAVAPAGGEDQDATEADPEKGVSDGEVADENIVWWDGPDDPENPANWPSWKKVVMCGFVSGFTFITPLASCKFSRSSFSFQRTFLFAGLAIVHPPHQ